MMAARTTSPRTKHVLTDQSRLSGITRTYKHRPQFACWRRLKAAFDKGFFGWKGGTLSGLNLAGCRPSGMFLEVSRPHPVQAIVLWPPDGAWATNTPAPLPNQSATGF